MTYPSRNSRISAGLGSSSSLTSSASASSSSMISLHRSMHSSQMYTPGPAMSFLTCFWLLPQNEHFSRSPPSPMRATQILLYMGPPRRPAERPAVPGEQVPRGGHELAYRRYRVRGSMDTIKPLP